MARSPKSPLTILSNVYINACPNF